MTKDLQKQIKNMEIDIFGKNSFPLEVQEEINEVMDIVQQNKTIPELYEKELKNTMVSSSIFQDICVQFNEHFTPHRKVRQAMLQLESSLGALDTAKNNHKKSIVKIQNLENEINELQDIFDYLDTNNSINLDIALRLSLITYTTKDGDNTLTNKIINDSTLNLIEKLGEYSNDNFINTLKDRIKVAVGNKIVDYEEANRSLKSVQHMAKDAVLKTVQLRKQADKYQTEVEESGISFSASEIIYYTLFFTAEAEKQLRTGDHQLDRGTYKVIAQLPEFIRKKVLSNISILKNMIEENSNINTDYYHLTHRELFEPKLDKKEDGLYVEGMKVSDYLMIDLGENA